MIAFGSSTARMHTSMLDMSKRTQSQGNLSPAKHAAGADVTATPGVATDATSGVGGALRAGRRATSSLSLTRRSHRDKPSSSLQSAALGMLVRLVAHVSFGLTL